MPSNAWSNRKVEKGDRAMDDGVNWTANRRRRLSHCTKNKKRLLAQSIFFRDRECEEF